MSEHVNDNQVTPETADERQPWTPLTFEKVDVADAQSGFTGIGPDNSVYS